MKILNKFTLRLFILNLLTQSMKDNKLNLLCIINYSMIIIKSYNLSNA